MDYIKPRYVEWLPISDEVKNTMPAMYKKPTKETRYPKIKCTRISCNKYFDRDLLFEVPWRKSNSKGYKEKVCKKCLTELAYKKGWDL